MIQKLAILNMEYRPERLGRICQTIGYVRFVALTKICLKPRNYLNKAALYMECRFALLHIGFSKKSVYYFSSTGNLARNHSCHPPVSAEAFVNPLD